MKKPGPAHNALALVKKPASIPAFESEIQEHLDYYQNATFDHPLLKLVGLDQFISIWREFAVESDGTEYLFLDEIQTQKDWQVWVKHQVDFDKRRRIAITGSAMSVLTQNQESGVGRWQTIRLPTLSFNEFLEIRKTKFHQLSQVKDCRSPWRTGQKSESRNLERDPAPLSKRQG